MNHINPNSIYLIVTEACNMRCTYCFETVAPTSARVVTDEVIDQSITLVMDGAKTTGTDFHINIFGGEPLLFPDKVMHILERTAHEAIIRNQHGLVDIHTNGTLWNNAIANICSYRCSHFKVRILVGIDGVQPIHDQFKCYKSDGSSNYDDVIANIPKFIDAVGNKTYVLSQTSIVKSSVPYMYESYKLLKDLGFGGVHFIKARIFDFSNIPAETQWGPSDLAMYEAQLSLIAQDIMQAADPLVEAQNFSTFGHCLNGKTDGPCDAGSTLIAITPDGNIYPCHGFYAGLHPAIGNVWEGYDDSALQFKWSDFGCEGCDTAFCDMCPAANYYQTGNMLEDGFKFHCKLNHIDTKVFSTIESMTIVDTEVVTPSATSSCSMLKPHAVFLFLCKACNMACTYCFNRSGQQLCAEDDVMNRDTIQKSIDFAFVNAIAKGVIPQINIYGGEPLLYPELVKHTFDYAYSCAQKAHTEVEMVLYTNGTLYSQIVADTIEYYKHKVKLSIMIALDGIQLTNDASRRYKNGDSAYCDVVINASKYLTLLADSPMACAPFMGLTNQALPHLFESYEFLKNLGFQRIHIKPIHEGGFTYNQTELELYTQQLGLIAEDIIKRFKATKNIDELLYVYPLSEHIRHTGVVCGAGNDCVAINGSGNIYACHAFYGVGDSPIGHIDTGIDFYQVKACHINDLSECQNCKVSFCATCRCSNLYAKLKAPTTCQISQTNELAASYILQRIMEE